MSNRESTFHFLVADGLIRSDFLFDLEGNWSIWKVPANYFPWEFEIAGFDSTVVVMLIKLIVVVVL